MIHIKTFLLFNLVCGGIIAIIINSEIARLLCIGLYMWFGALHLGPFLCDVLGIDREGGVVTALYLFIGGPVVGGFIAAYFGSF